MLAAVSLDVLEGASSVALSGQPQTFEQDGAAEFEVVKMIQDARGQAVAAVNTTLIDLYWRIGEYISRKLETAAWGEGVVEALARYIQRHHPNLRGFTRPNLFRMRQFFEAYKGDEKVSPLVRQLPWTHHLIILGQSKRVRKSGNSACAWPFASNGASESWNASSGPLHSNEPSSARQSCHRWWHKCTLRLQVSSPREHSENDLHRGLVHKLKDFLIELGRDFCFVGSEYPVQVGKRDFELDLLFFHRGLNCLCAIELKVGRFEPEHLGKLNFYGGPRP